MAGAAVLLLDRASETILYCNPAATLLLAQSAPDILGRSCWDVLGLPRDTRLPLAQALRDSARTTLPPMLLTPPETGEMAVGGYLFAQRQDGRDTVVLLLFQLASGRDPLFARAIGPGDLVAVLGVDDSDQQAPRTAGDRARRMMDIRFGLQQIVPARQDVGLPVGAAIPIALRNTSIEQGQDISRALLSHLAAVVGGGARIRIGLARCREGESPLATLLAANNALLRLQRFSAGEQIAAAGERDAQVLAACAAAAEGIFAEGFGACEQRNYLSSIVALSPEPPHGKDYLSQVIALTLEQRGVSAAALYRRRFDDQYDLVSGGHSAQPGLAWTEEKQVPRAMRQVARKLDTGQLREQDYFGPGNASVVLCSLRLNEHVLGYMALQYGDGAGDGERHFVPGIAALHHVATEIAALADWRQASDAPALTPVAVPRPVEERIDGYVGDNMEGAIDQAIFLSRLDVPVAVIGPRGTGKLYVAKVIHQETGAAPEQLVAVDCREFRSRKDSLHRIARILERSAGKTLVFKSPHQMNPDAQLKLARQIGSRILADTSPPRYLPAARIIALFPDDLEHLVRHGGLNERLASVFAAYPIRVPPIRDRKRAVLRWAHKILTQEASRRDRKITGFTPDAEQAMLQHDWPGNISEMRQCIVSALDKTDKEWLTPVDLGIFKGLSPAGPGGLSPKRAFLQDLVEAEPEDSIYTPTTPEELGVALGEALHALLQLDTIKPLGAWLDDEVILAVCERYRDNMRAAADFLQTKPRNIRRWMPKVLARDHERGASSLWQTPQRLVKQWVREAAPMPAPPQQMAQAMLLAHVVSQCGDLSVADRAGIMGVSTPTYQKRLQEFLGQ